MGILAESYIHTLQGEILDLPGPLAVRWYGISYLAGFVVAWLIMRWLAARGHVLLTVKQVGDLMFYMVAGVVIGGRLGYCVFYEPTLLWPPWGVLQVWRGGMASHGGIIGVIAACMIYGRRNGVSQLHVVDIAAFTVPPGLMLGRLANFVNGELWGKALPAAQQGSGSPWWSIKYPEELRRFVYTRHEEMRNLTVLADEAGVDHATWRARIGDYAIVDRIPNESAQLVHRWFDRITDAVREGNEVVIATLQDFLTAYYPSQLFQAFAEGVVLLAVLVVVWLRPRKPGVVGSWFLLTYGVLRICTEIFRQPDEGIAVLETPLGDLSRGQVLSVAMVLAGAICIVIASKRRVAPVGGLLHDEGRETPARDE